MNATAANLQTVSCPKCFGAKVFSVFSHIYEGKCYGCHGAGVVSMKVAYELGYRAPIARTAGKVIALPGFGEVRIERDSCGFVAYVLDEMGELPAYFTVTGRTVRITEICNGLRNQRAEIEAALAAALR